MKQIYFSLLIGLPFLSSCDNREKKAVEPLLDSPQLILTDLNGKAIVQDSIKLSLKSKRKEGGYLLTLQGGSAKKDLTAIAVNGSGTLKVGGLPEGFSRLSNGTYQVIWKPTAPSEALLRFTMVDESNVIREALLEIATFDNLPPIARLETKKIDQIAASEYLLDASTSYDRDGKYGGFIASYEFTIGTKKFITNTSSMKWIFSTSGTYVVLVKVTDGDGASHSVSDTLIVK